MNLRAATRQDFQAIRRLIWQVGINPTGLDWRRFLVAVGDGGELLGCGQVKPHGRAVRELASIAVAKHARGSGVARRIIEQLMGQTQGPVYLTCRTELKPFYEKFGFQVITDAAAMPAYFARIHTLFRLLQMIHGGSIRLLVMVCQNS